MAAEVRQESRDEAQMQRTAGKVTPEPPARHLLKE